MKSGFLKIFVMWLLLLSVSSFYFLRMFFGTYDTVTSKERVSSLVGIFIFIIPIALLITFFHKWAVEARKKLPKNGEGEIIDYKENISQPTSANIVTSKAGRFRKRFKVFILSILFLVGFTIFGVPYLELLSPDLAFVVGYGGFELLAVLILYIFPMAVLYFCIRFIIRHSFK